MNNSQLLGKFPYYLILRVSGTALQGPCINLPTSTATPTPMADESMADESMADESMADEFKVEESMADNTILWRIPYIHKLRKGDYILGQVDDMPAVSILAMRETINRHDGHHS